MSTSPRRPERNGLPKAANAGSNPAGDTRVAIYARISKDDPAVDAIADQERRCQDLAAREGYVVTTAYSDDGISGFSGKYRPGWVELQHAIQSGTLDVVLAVAEDRFTRNAQEKEGFQFECARRGVRWHTIGGGVLDPSTAGGALMARLTGGIAQYESQLKSERVAASVVRRRMEGRDIGGPRPFGFSKDRRSLIESEAELVRAGHRMLLDGKTVYAVVKMFINSGVSTVKGGDWSYVIVHKILTRPRNAALAVTKEGEEYELTEYPAIVSREDHEAVAALLTKSTQKFGRKSQHLASGGVARCGTCGSALRFSSQQGGIYRCDAANSGRGRVDDQVHPSVKAADLDARIRIEVVPALIAKLRRGEDEGAAAGATVRVLLAQNVELERQRDEAQELWTLPGANKAKLRIQLASFGEQIEALEAQIDSARVAGVASIRPIAAALIDSMDERITEAQGAPSAEGVILDTLAAGALFRERWASMQLDDQRALARAVLDVRIYPAAVARKLRMERQPDGSTEVVVVREGPERIAIRHI